MSFKYIYRCVLCVLLLVATPTNEVNAQATQVVKTVSKWFGKKAAKEGAEEVVEQGVKAISKDMAQKAITKNAANAIYKPSATLARKNLQEYAATNIGKTFTTKLGKELGEGALKTMSKEFAQQIGKSSSKEFQELFIKRLGTESTQEVGEWTAKKTLKESAAKNIAKKQAAKTAARLTGADAFKALDDMPDIKKQVIKLQQQSPTYFTTDKLFVEKVGKSKVVGFEGTPSKIEISPNGTIRAKGGSTANAGPMNEYLNNPLPNTKYETEGGLLNFHTDQFGKTAYVECHSSELYKTMKNNPRGTLAKENQTPLVIKKGGKKGVHDSGHIQQRSMGGLNESINLLPMKSQLQQHGRWAKLEGEERKAIAAGKDVWSRKWITNNPDGSYSIKVELTIDGKKITKVFDDLF
jgi:hypothetical protein